MAHFFSGFIGEPTGQLNVCAKALEFIRDPNTRALEGLCGSFKISSLAVHKDWAKDMKNS
jgi:hypothetical protein